MTLPLKVDLQQRREAVKVVIQDPHDLLPQVTRLLTEAALIWLALVAVTRPKRGHQLPAARRLRGIPRAGHQHHRARTLNRLSDDDDLNSPRTTTPSDVQRLEDQAEVPDPCICLIGPGLTFRIA